MGGSDSGVSGNSPHRRSPVERALAKPCRRPSSREGTVSSGSSTISKGNGHVSGTRATCGPTDDQSWARRRAPFREGALVGRWLSPGMRLEYTPVTATSALSLAAGLSSSFADPSVDLGEDQVTFL